jgi:hypothetical protein
MISSFKKNLCEKINLEKSGSLIKIWIQNSFILIKRQRNAIDFLKLPLGIWSFERQEIGNCFTSHFKNLFSFSIPTIDKDLLSLFDNCITLEINDSIYALPSKQEIFSVLTSIGFLKAPGPNGFTALFYKTYWSTVKDVVLSSIWDFFGSNRLLKKQNHTFITLIPKQFGAFFYASIPNHQSVQIYKIISKILVNRFKSLLHLFISFY